MLLYICAHFLTDVASNRSCLRALLAVAPGVVGDHCSEGDSSAMFSSTSQAGSADFPSRGERKRTLAEQQL